MSRVLILFILVLASFSVSAEKVLVAVAANFTQTANSLKSAFERESEHTLTLSYGSSGKLFAQIINQAPYGIFLSADSERPKRLEELGLIKPNSRFTYALGQLTLWSQSLDVTKAGLNAQLLKQIPRFAIANPDIAPYGQAALEVLKNLSLESSLGGKLVKGESVSQAFQFIATGNAAAGLIASTQLLSWSGPEGFSWSVPTSLYQPIRQQAVILERAKNNPAAIAFFDFLKSRQARNIIEQEGYALEHPDKTQ